MASTFPRRTLVKGAVWATPTAIVATAAPAIAASSCPDQSELAQLIDAQFADHAEEISRDVGDLSQNTIRFWFTDTVPSANGSLHNPAIAFRNMGPAIARSVFQRHPLEIDIQLRNVRTSKAVNDLVARMDERHGAEAVKVRQGGVRQVPRPWYGSGQLSEGDRPYTGAACTGSRRDFSFSTSYGSFHDSDAYRELGRVGIGQGEGRCGGDGNSSLSYVFGLNDIDFRANSGTNMVAFQMRDGYVGSGQRIYQGVGIRPRGFLPPSWEHVSEQIIASLPDITREELEDCGALEIYSERVEKWHSAGESTLGLTFEVVGWAPGYDQQPTALSTTAYAWSDELGNYSTSGSEGDPNLTALPYYPFEDLFVIDGRDGTVLAVDKLRGFDGIF